MRKTLRSAEHARFLALLIQARRQLGLTQQQLAKKLNRHQSFVAKYENGERRIDLIEFTTIARAMNADPIFLFKRFLTENDGGESRKRKSRTSKSA